ncbi:MAG: V-type ATP synthase subunit I, partial [Lachnospiraceae bacterium]|nr:V-type ATP synthase subunit I [Lachnospiraceae bacterium]
MAVLQMQKIHICALKSNRKQILEELQRKGIVQVETDGQEDEIFRKMDTGNVRSGYEKRAQNAEAALKVLGRYAPEKAGLLSSLEGKKVISTEEYYAQVKDQEAVVKIVTRILALEKEIAETRASQVRADVTLESLIPWMSLDVPMNYKGSRTTAALIGTLPGQWTLEQVLGAIAEAQPELEAYTMEVLGADKDQTCLFGVCAKADVDRLEDALRVNGFARPSTMVSQTPAAYAEELEQTRAGYRQAEEQALEQLKALAE